MIGSFLRGLAAKTRLRYEKAERMTHEVLSNGRREQPSWINDPAFMKTMVEMTFESALKAGMTKEEAKYWFSQADVADCVITSLAQFEKIGFNKFDQISGACELTEKLARYQVALLRAE